MSLYNGMCTGFVHKGMRKAEKYIHTCTPHVKVHHVDTHVDVRMVCRHMLIHTTCGCTSLLYIHLCTPSQALQGWQPWLEGGDRRTWKDRVRGWRKKTYLGAGVGAGFGAGLGAGLCKWQWKHVRMVDAKVSTS